MLETCVPEDYAMVMSGGAIIKDYILLGYTAPNGTDVYLLNGTTVGEQLIGDTGNGSNVSTPSGTIGAGSPPQQTAKPSGNGVASTGMDARGLGGVLLSLILAVVLQIVHN